MYAEMYGMDLKFEMHMCLGCTGHEATGVVDMHHHRNINRKNSRTLTFSFFFSPPFPLQVILSEVDCAMRECVS